MAYSLLIHGREGESVFKKFEAETLDQLAQVLLHFFAGNRVAARSLPGLLTESGAGPSHSTSVLVYPRGTIFDAATNQEIVSPSKARSQLLAEE